MSLLAAAAAATAAMTAASTAIAAAIAVAIAAAIAAAFLVDCCMWNPPLPLPRLSHCLMKSSSHRGHRCQTTPNPAKPMPGSHRVIIALPHWPPSPLAATACLLCRRCCHRCHKHLPLRQQNDWRRRQQSTTAGRQLHCCCPLWEEEGTLCEVSTFTHFVSHRSGK